MLNIEEESFLQRTLAAFPRPYSWSDLSKNMRDKYCDLFLIIKDFVLEGIDIDYVMENFSGDIDDIRADARQEGYDEGFEMGQEYIYDKLSDL